MRHVVVSVGAVFFECGTNTLMLGPTGQIDMLTCIIRTISVSPQLARRTVNKQTYMILTNCCRDDMHQGVRLESILTLHLL